MFNFGESQWNSTHYEQGSFNAEHFPRWGAGGLKLMSCWKCHQSCGFITHDKEWKNVRKLWTGHASLFGTCMGINVVSTEEHLVIPFVVTAVDGILKFTL